MPQFCPNWTHTVGVPAGVEVHVKLEVGVIVNEGVSVFVRVSV